MLCLQGIHFTSCKAIIVNAQSEILIYIIKSFTKLLSILYLLVRILEAEL